MFTYVKKIVLFTITFCFIYLTVLQVYGYLKTPKNTNALYIWGDSQMEYGINFKVLENKTGRPVYTASKCGAGVYSFLVFAKSVEPKSTVIVSMPFFALIRRKELDNNLSFLDLVLLSKLYGRNYSFLDLYNIIHVNRRMSSCFQSIDLQGLLEVRDTLAPVEKIEFLKKISEKVPNYYKDKESVFLLGLEKLKEKECCIVLVSFPFNDMLKSHIEKKQVGHAYRGTYRLVDEKMGSLKQDTLIYDSEKPPMFDYTHLNISGANYLTEDIVKKINTHDFQKSNHHLVYLLQK